ncbi:MAG TPA: vanadium-dependent haloperoxidase [Gemmatimonadaceae bacterium]|nr:vanadium-dependent haloperoxidase [Gemmatimonadaceae bacterium]
MRLHRLLFVAMLIGFSKPATSIAQADGKHMPVSVRWNRLVPGFLDQLAVSRQAARKAAAAAGDSAALRRIAMTPPPFLFRVYTLLSLAQYAAVNSARGNNNVSSDAAVAHASAAALRAIFADSTVRASIARELARDTERLRNALASKTLGEDVAQRVIAWAPPFNLIAPWNGTIPKGPGMWYSAPGVPPIGVMMGQSRTWLLESPSQFRPAPPPTFGSPQWQSALEEVQRVARNRTAQETQIAQKWNSVDPWGPWNQTASEAIVRHHLSNADAARVLAMLNVGASDAIIACFEAKYHYWSIRPSQADTTLTLADDVDLPNFPSYPSGHACSAGAFDAALGHFFPDERAQFTRIAEEQAMSRLYGGIHYRFDNDTGLALGRAVARKDIEIEKRGGLNAWRTAGVVKKR